MISSTPTIKVLSKLDWPGKLKSSLAVQCVGPSFLLYKSRRELRTCNFLNVSSDKKNDITTIDSNHIVNDKVKHSIDLNTLSTKQLDKLTYYEILGGLELHSTPEQIKRAFHKACLKYHPDKNDSSTSLNRLGKENDDSKSEDLPGKKKKAKEDPIFLKVKEAFETLSSAQKRKSYDSTIKFDESTPSQSDSQTDEKFYRIFGSCFERNLRFASENDPDILGSKSNQNNRLSKGRGKSNGRHNNKLKPRNTKLGNESTSIEDVHDFYDYWIKFESWRDFTLPATKLTEHDTDMAGCRYEKRWMEKEILRKSRSMKKDEMARIQNFVELSLSCDPRLKRERGRLEKEKSEKVRIKKESQEQKERELKEMEAETARKDAVKEAKEKVEKAKAKEKKDQDKKLLRKARQSFRKAVFSVKPNDIPWSSPEEMNDAIELLCDKLSIAKLESVRNEMSSHDNDLNIIMEHATLLEQGENEKAKAELAERDLLRQEAAKKEAIAKAAKASKSWEKLELSALAKAVKKYPSGGANRWESIALFINNLCRLQDLRTKEECIEKYNQLTTSGNSVNPNNSEWSSQSTEAKESSNSPETTNNISEVCVEEWTEEQDKQLQAALREFPPSLDKNQRWTSVSKAVDQKTKKECVQRFKAIRGALKKK